VRPRDPRARSLAQGPDPTLPGRSTLFAVFLVLVFGIFAGRLFQLQIVEGADLARRSRDNAVRSIRLDAPRGEIVDRKGRVLVTTRPAFELQVVPNDLRRSEVVFALLGHFLHSDPEVLRARVGSPRGPRRFQAVALHEDLPFEGLARIEAHAHALPGVAIETRPRRHYLEGALAAHLLGTVGEVRAEQLARPEFEGYRQGEVVGQTGLEARLEEHLRGRQGGRNVVVDVAGREVGLVEQIAPVTGGTAVLSLDLDLQRAGEDAFSEVAEGELPKVGAVVALDVRNGDVLAMVSRPAFDPNAFAGGIDAATWRALNQDEWKPLQNRAIQAHYPPGSTYKAIVAAAALQEGVVTPQTRAFCSGGYRFGNRTYRCWKREGHGSVDLHDALKRSCDVYFYTQGVRLGVDRLARIAKAFQLGRPTGIGLAHEAPGIVPSSEWKQERFREPWYAGETVSVAIGQGYNVMTPLQLAVSYAAIANGGKVWRPRLVQRLLAPDGSVAREIEPELIRELPVAPEHLAAVRSGLEAVVEEPGGTGSRARVPGVRVAGKTGTSQVVRLEHTEHLAEHAIPIRQRDHAWFGAFAPADAPEIAVAVFVEHGAHGSTAAAPIAQRVLARYFEKKLGPPPPAPVQTAAGSIHGVD
jgi:penicillin-binding protein 2